MIELENVLYEADIEDAGCVELEDVGSEGEAGELLALEALEDCKLELTGVLELVEDDVDGTGPPGAALLEVRALDVAEL